MPEFVKFLIGLIH